MEDHFEEIQGIPGNSRELADYIQLYKQIGETAPLEIEQDWEYVTQALQAAAALRPGDADELQTVLALTFSSERAAVRTSEWIERSCGLEFPVGTIAPGAATSSSTAPTTSAG